MTQTTDSPEDLVDCRVRPVIGRETSALRAVWDKLLTPGKAATISTSRRAPRTGFTDRRRAGFRDHVGGLLLACPGHRLGGCWIATNRIACCPTGVEDDKHRAVCRDALRGQRRSPVRALLLPC